MWSYDKKLQYPVKIKSPNPAMAKIIMTQLGGPDGEAGAAMRYLHQRYSCPYDKVTGTLTDIGTEELGHMEMIAAIVYQLTRNLCIDDIKKSGYDAYFVDHTTGIYPVSAVGAPFSVASLASKGDLITDLHEDLAAEQKARTTYDNILRMADDPDVKDVIRFLREREIVHYQRFGEAKRTNGSGWWKCRIRVVEYEWGCRFAAATPFVICDFIRANLKIVVLKAKGKSLANTMFVGFLLCTADTLCHWRCAVVMRDTQRSSNNTRSQHRKFH